MLQDFQVLCGKETRKILKYCSVQWLSLGLRLKRLLSQWEPLTIFFRAEFANGSFVKSITKELSSKTRRQKEKAADSVTVTGNVKTVQAAKLQIKTASVEVAKPVKSTLTQDKKKSQQSTTMPQAGESSKSHDKATNSAKTSKAGESSKTVSHDKATNSCKETVQSSSKTTKKVPESRLERILRMLISPQTWLYCMFLDHVIPVFDASNVQLQKEAPLIHKLRGELLSLVRNLLIKFVCPSAMSAGSSLLTVCFDKRENQKDDSDLLVGNEVRDFISSHTAPKMNVQDLSFLNADDVKNFYISVRKFYETAVTYLLKKLPLSNSHTNGELLLHAEVANVSLRTEQKFTSVMYFVNSFPVLLLVPTESNKARELDQLEEEFAKYQVDPLTDAEKTIDRADIQWSQLARKYPRLARVMLGILTIPHSNASCERIFSLVRKNKTDFRPNLGQNSLEALLVEKVWNISEEMKCYERRFSKDVLRKMKSATCNALKGT